MSFHNWQVAFDVVPLKNGKCVWDPFNQDASLCAIRTGIVCNNYSERHAMRIHGQMYLGVEPPFERLIA
jgi:hypothetical protein